MLPRKLTAPRYLAFTAVLLLAPAAFGCGSGAGSETDASERFALAATVAAAPTGTPVPATPAPTSTGDAATPAAASASPQPRAQAVPAAPSARSEPTSAPAPTATSVPTRNPTVTPLPAPSPTTAEAPPPTISASPVPARASGQAQEIRFEELYAGASITGPILSDRANSLNGRKVAMSGFMAPPLKPDLDFFVLTQTPMVYCPFCNTAADWPFNIVFVRMAGGQSVPPVVPSQGIRVTGTFSVGVDTDQATGFVSLVRIYADSVSAVQ